MRTTPARLLAAAAVLALAPPVFAQEAGAPATAAEPASEGVDEIVVSAQRDNETQVRRGGQIGILGDKAAEDVPFSVKTYNSALILNQQPLTLGQVLENDPSIRTTYGFGNAAEQFVIRGFTVYGDDVGLDGLYGLAPRQLVAPELYENVQVLNGANAFLNGAAPGGSGVGGSINLSLKRAADRDLNRATVSYLSKEHFGGSYDVSRRFGDAGEFGVRINGAFRTGDVGISNEFRRAAVIGGAFDYRGAAVRLSLDVAYQKITVRRLRPKVTVTSFVPRVPDADANYAQDYTYSELRDVFGIGRLEWDVADNALFYAQIGARDGAEDGIYGGIRADAPDGTANGNALFVPRTDNNEAAQAGFRVKLAGGGVSHEINLGGNHVRQVNRNAYDFLYGPGFAGFQTNLYNTPDVPLPASSLVGGDLDNPFPIERVRLTSLFASETLGLFDDRLLITGGLRLQKIDVRGYDIADGRQNRRYDEDAVTPVVGIVAKPVAGLSIFANRIEALQQGPTASTIDPTIINPGEIFAPYRSVQYEVGGKFSTGPINISLAAFRTELPSAYSVPEPGRPGFFRFGVFGEQRNQGIEFSIDGELARGLRLIAGASYIEAKLTRTLDGVNQGKGVPGVPDLLANANVEWDLPFARGFTLTGRAVYTGGQPVNPANTLEIGDWARFDLGARYVALVEDQPVTFRFGVDNVANSRYWASAFDPFGTSLLQGQPRTFRFSATLDLR